MRPPALPCYLPRNAIFPVEEMATTHRQACRQHHMQLREQTDRRAAGGQTGGQPNGWTVDTETTAYVVSPSADPAAATAT